MKERRKNKRAKENLPLKIADNTFDIITETVDISSTGTYCQITKCLPLMSKIELMLMLPSRDKDKDPEKIKCQGVVVRSEPVILKHVEKAHYNVAIYFTEISKKDQKIIEKYINADEGDIQLNLSYGNESNKA